MLDWRASAVIDRQSKSSVCDVLPGLQQPRKVLSPKFFYDEYGLELFDRITMTPEYYVTRAEIEILTRHAPIMTDTIGPRFALVELGGADCRKARMLLTSAAWPLVYVPVDVSPSMLRDAARHIRKELPAVVTAPMVADFTRLTHLPPEAGAARSTMFYCAGSTLGNFTPARASNLLAQWSRLAANSWCLIGIDLKKEPSVLNAAYNDSGGYTAAFNLNILTHLNREFDADFDLDDFEHVAAYDERAGCIRMQLRCLRAHTVHVDGHPVSFAAGELIQTEESYKYTVDEFRAVAEAAGLVPQHHWTDSDKRFSVHLLSRPLRPL